MSELKRLAQLRDQGIITDDDFEAKKKQILGIQNARFRRRRELPLAIAREASVHPGQSEQRSKPCAAGSPTQAPPS